eukprot:1159398-Pelagomonas_calceolata.AAC.8
MAAEAWLLRCEAAATSPRRSAREDCAGGSARARHVGEGKGTSGVHALVSGSEVQHTVSKAWLRGFVRACTNLAASARDTSPLPYALTWTAPRSAFSSRLAWPRPSSLWGDREWATSRGLGTPPCHCMYTALCSLRSHSIEFVFGNAKLHLCSVHKPLHYLHSQVMAAHGTAVAQRVSGDHLLPVQRLAKVGLCCDSVLCQLSFPVIACIQRPIVDDDTAPLPIICGLGWREEACGAIDRGIHLTECKPGQLRILVSLDAT